jgi:predicted DNA binding CopG/RHH family protein
MIEVASSKGVFVDLEGEVIGVRGAPLKPFKSSNGYLNVSLKRLSKNYNIPVHRLQAYQKFGNMLFEKGLVVIHRDGDKENNSWDNIGLVTHSESKMNRSKEDRVEHALKAAKITRRFSENDIRDIRRSNQNGVSLSTLAKNYDTSKGHLSSIVNRRIYRNVAD